MKKALLSVALTLLALLMMTPALADRMYVLPESDQRRLTWEEVAEWDYESLGYAYNEIFARHGYCFEAGKAYDNYFRAMPWYTPNADPRNQVACYPKLTSVEWYNVELIKQVRAAKKDDDSGRSIWDSFSTGFDALQGFSYVRLRSGQKLAVYTAPDDDSVRGAEGKAVASTNGAIYAAGWEGDWLLVMYETNAGAVRVGYINGNKVRGGVPLDTSLRFDHCAATVLAACCLTDDPATCSTTIVQLRPGAQVTWLTRFYNNTAWDYVEVTVDGQTARGFVPVGCLSISYGADPLEQISTGY
ncbi:MAG: YARHG domain-containing protein [Clostridia bacterium]|nr:YARHG domain-containing protein [Clostridia bacterium]